jgi:cyclic-di-AMP phosphodiesterase PgpH
MSGTQVRTRSDRVASLQLNDRWWQRWFDRIGEGGLWDRWLIAALAAAIILVAGRCWDPPASFRMGEIPQRDIVARISFDVVNPTKTNLLREQRKREVLVFYSNRTQPLTQVREGLKDELFAILQADSLDRLDAPSKLRWQQFIGETAAIGPLSPTATTPSTETPLPAMPLVSPPTSTSSANPPTAPANNVANGSSANSGSVVDGAAPTIDLDGSTPPANSAADGSATIWQSIKTTLANDPKLQLVDEAVQAAMLPLYNDGILKSLGHTIEEGNQRSIQVYPAGSPDDPKIVAVDGVRVVQIEPAFRERLTREMVQRFPVPQASDVATLLDQWLFKRLQEIETLTYDSQRAEEARIREAEKVEPVKDKFYAGTSLLARAGAAIGEDELRLLKNEHEALIQTTGTYEKALRVISALGMIVAMYVLCGLFIHLVEERRLLSRLADVTRLLGLVTFTFVACSFAIGDRWRLEVFPIVLAACTATIVYGRPLAVLLLVAVCLAVCLLLGQDLESFIVLISASLSAILLTGRIKADSRLLQVGLGAAAITAATTIGAGIVAARVPLAALPAGAKLTEQPSPSFAPLMFELLQQSVWHFGSAIMAGIVMTGLRTTLERIFSVQTDLTLMYLGNTSHVLLRELAQRAPGTYNHSISVASIAEAAAESIGANGPLVRAGANFHDIGKMFKPNYFIENQGQGPNQHATLQPAMSTLVIIAHVKDGADLARSHHLPQSIIDFIEQHHGTTLVEYFYRQATERSLKDPDGQQVAERDFRYPGPKPQSIEAAILMLADTLESASRALVEPTPGRIQTLVEDISMKKLIDGQFDECGMTLRQLAKIKQSMIKSITAIYHARVKYPGQQSA